MARNKHPEETVNLILDVALVLYIHSLLEEITSV